MKRLALLVLAGGLVVGPLEAQGLRDKIGELFIFSEGGDPLFLAGSADPDNPLTVQAHGTHFIPSAVSNNQTLIAFITNAIGTNVANLPLSATSSGQTFRFEGGLPVATSTSSGPIFAERAPTLGRGRLLLGASVNVFNFKTLRGVRLDQIQMNFHHTNADFQGCDAAFGDDCSLLGVPAVENDVIELNLELDLNVVASWFLLTYGLTDRIDVGFAVPFISTSLDGRSTATVIPFGDNVNHFFEGTPSNPDFTASRSVNGSATGIGDIAGRIKIQVASPFSILTDVRLPTGSAEELLGSGETAVRGLGIFSTQLGDFTPHANVGYLYRTGELQTDAVLAALGFDHSLATLAVDFLSEFQVGTSNLTVPDPVTIQAPFTRIIESANIPQVRDDLLTGSLGFKFVTGVGVTVVTSALWPLNDGGLRPDAAWNLGFEYNF